MDADALGPVEAPLQRAKLHIRAGKRRLRQGKISAGIITLYDALISAVEWYVEVPGRREGLQINEGDDLNNEKTLFTVLNRSRVLDETFDYAAIETLVEKALNSEMIDYDYRAMLKGIESVMTQLGVRPFDENALPPEDPAAF
jgi:hypothetical protein